jgi:hypothetical protein
MAIRSTAIALGVGVLIASPASAATYTGTLQGVITSGSAFYSDGLAEDYYETTVPLVGKDITIAFTSDVDPNHYDDYSMMLVRLVTNTATVQIDSPGRLDFFSTTQSNDYYNTDGTADFTGDAANGSFHLSGFVGDPDLAQSAIFTFANATSTQGPLSGSGTASAVLINPYDPIFNDTYNVTFRLVSGFVTGPGAGVPLGTPEPATWSLMIMGFGAIGMAMRGRNRRPVHAVA